VNDGRVPVDVMPGFEIAPGEACDVEVANAHAWQSYCLIFNDGQGAATALNIADCPARKGTM
jgi:hypothetical protein